LSSQAETIYFNADAGRLIARNADFISEQDTLQLKGYAWFYRSLVAGADLRRLRQRRGLEPDPPF
jgi:hypothetical protein